MKNKKTYKTKSKTSTVNEPLSSYGDTRIIFFKSFEEENEFAAKERAEIPHDKRMIYIEELRKRIFNKYLLSDGLWSPIEKIFKIMPPYTNDISK